MQNHTAAWHRAHLRKISRRAAVRHWKTWRPQIASDARAKQRVAARDLYELGIEYHPSRAQFPEKPKGKVAKTPKRRRTPERRAADTYRAARYCMVRNERGELVRKQSMAQRLKAERLASGETLAQADRRRQQAAVTA